MNTLKRNSQYLCAAACLACILILCAQSGAIAQGQQKIFATPDQAANALIDACKAHSEQKLIELFGAENRDLIVTRDRAMDAMIRTKIYRGAAEKLVKQKRSSDTIILLVGKIEYPFPFPLVRDGKGWRFDGPAGREEIINRRIGRDELNAIAICRHYVKAQRKYADRDRNNDDVIEYARKIGSSEGKKDGLYWPSDPGKKEEMSPLGCVLSESKKYAELRKPGEPFYGYYFKILTRQGARAPGGAYDYIINGHMVAGCAMIAYPSDYGISGVTTFIVNQRGKVFQKDLGKDTLKAAEEITEYNPDKSWKTVQENGTLATD